MLRAKDFYLFAIGQRTRWQDCMAAMQCGPGLLSATRSAHPCVKQPALLHNLHVHLRPQSHHSVLLLHPPKTPHPPIRLLPELLRHPSQRVNLSPAGRTSKQQHAMLNVAYDDDMATRYGPQTSVMGMELNYVLVSWNCIHKKQVGGCDAAGKSVSICTTDHSQQCVDQNNLWYMCNHKAEDMRLCCFLFATVSRNLPLIERAGCTFLYYTHIITFKRVYQHTLNKNSKAYIINYLK